HIHDPEIVKLAHPGLVLRRVSAELILEVLKEPCKLSITNLDQARALYQELSRETALVAEETTGWLKHRQDLRRTMLKLVIAKQPRVAEEIHRRAIDFYQRHEVEDGDAEEIYHRLMLPELSLPRDRVARLPMVRSSLTPNVGELPVRSQILLASVGYNIADEI